MNPGQVIKPAVTKELAREMVTKLYGFEVTSMEEMVSFDDKNFHIKISIQHNNPYVEEVLPDGYTLKVTNTAKSALPGHFESMHSAMRHLHGKGLSVPVPIQNLQGATWCLQKVPLLQKPTGDDKVDNDGTGLCGVHLLTFLPGAPISTLEYNTSSVMFDWGNLLAQFHDAVQDLSNDVLKRKEIFWNLEHIPEIKSFMKGLSIERSSLVLSVLDQYDEKISSALPHLPKGFIHGDFNENNVLVRKVNVSGEQSTPSWKVEGILDLEDMHWGTYAWDIGMMLAYVSLECKSIDPLEGMGHCLAGYLQRRSLTEEEMSILKMCICCRLCQSLVLGAYSYSLEPSNTYLMVSARFGWDRLKLIWNTDDEFLMKTWQNIIKKYSQPC